MPYRGVSHCAHVYIKPFKTRIEKKEEENAHVYTLCLYVYSHTHIYIYEK